MKSFNDADRWIRPTFVLLHIVAPSSSTVFHMFRHQSWSTIFGSRRSLLFFGERRRQRLCIYVSNLSCSVPACELIFIQWPTRNQVYTRMKCVFGCWLTTFQAPWRIWYVVGYTANDTQSVLNCIWLILLEPHTYWKFTKVYELALFWIMVTRRRSHFFLVVASSPLNYRVESDMFDYTLPRTVRLCWISLMCLIWIHNVCLTSVEQFKVKSKRFDPCSVQVFRNRRSLCFIFSGVSTFGFTRRVCRVYFQPFSCFCTQWPTHIPDVYRDEVCLNSRLLRYCVSQVSLSILRL